MSPKTPTLAAVLRTAVENRLAEVHVMLPGKIDSYDPATQKARVVLMVNRFQKSSDGTTIGGGLGEPYPAIDNVPVAFPRAGAFSMTFPVNEGDNVTVIFCESSIDAYQLSNGREQMSPDVFNRFDLSDAVAFLGWYPDGKVASSTDQEDIVIGEADGPAVHIGRDMVNLYEKDAADFVALAQSVLDELDLVKTDFDGFKTAYDSHIHTTTATVSAGSPGVIAPTVSSVPTPHTPASVAAEKVKAT